MSVRLLSLVAAAAATLVAVAPAPEARAAAATNVPVMKSENSVVTQGRRRGGGHHFRHYRGGGPRFVHGGGRRYVHRGWVGPRYRHSRRWRGPGFAVYAGVPFVGSSYYYGNSCHWLKRRAINTGSRYWWRRYNACRYGW